MGTANDKKGTEKDTNELDQILGSTHISQIETYYAENADSLREEDHPFSQYMKKLIYEKRLKQRDVFEDADIPVRYGYKLLSEEKRTRQRDVILRLCYAAHFTLEETQRALKMYDMPVLYSKVKRDALLMIAFNERPGGLVWVNDLLESHNMEPLRFSGMADDMEE